MTEIHRMVGLGELEKINIEATPIQPASAAAPSPAPPSARADATGSSRFPAKAPTGPLAARWTADLDASFPPVSVVENDGHVLVQGSGLWQLFDRQGKPVATGRAGSVALDPEHGLLYGVNADNFLQAFRMSDGTSAFLTHLTYGDTFTRPFLWRHKNRLVVVGIEGEGGPHRPTPPDRSVVEYIEVGDPIAVDDSGLLSSITAAGQLIPGTNRLVAAMHDDTLVFAGPNIVCFAKTNLDVTAALQGEFTPVSMSLDEAGRVYLVVEHALWVLTPDGKRVVDVELEEEFRNLIAPPVVGYDHRVFLLTASRIRALEADGSVAWEREADGILGGGVTVDGKLLLANGSGLVVYDAKGDREVVHKGAPMTVPVLTADGTVLVVDGGKLVALGAD